MKKIFSFLIVLYMNTSNGQDYSFYKNDKQIPLTINTRSIFIGSNTIDSIGDMIKLIGDNFNIARFNYDHTSRLLNKFGNTKFGMKDIFWVEIMPKDSTLSKEQYIDLLNLLKGIKDINYVSPAVSNERNEKMLLSHLFYVKLHSIDDIDELKNIASQTNTTIMGNTKHLPNWYVLTSNSDSKGNSIEMAKYFYETGKFVATEPDLIGAAKTTTCSSSDPLFTDQWNLNNTAQQSSDQSGFDIHACDAWSITTGDPSILIGLLDNGPSL